jgi:hypothetical protein
MLYGDYPRVANVIGAPQVNRFAVEAVTQITAVSRKNWSDVRMSFLYGQARSTERTL